MKTVSFSETNTYSYSCKVALCSSENEVKRFKNIGFFTQRTSMPRQLSYNSTTCPTTRIVRTLTQMFVTHLTLLQYDKSEHRGVFEGKLHSFQNLLFLFDWVLATECNQSVSLGKKCCHTLLSLEVSTVNTNQDRDWLVSTCRILLFETVNFFLTVNTFVIVCSFSTVESFLTFHFFLTVNFSWLSMFSWLSILFLLSVLSWLLLLSQLLNLS